MSAVETQLRSPPNFVRWIVRAALVALIILVIGVALTATLAVRSALTAENNLLAMLDTIDACTTYVESHDGAWPKNWADIEPLIPIDRRHDVRQRVLLDFDTAPSELAGQNWLSFTGIQPKMPIYKAYQGQLNGLIDVLRKFHNSNGS